VSNNSSTGGYLLPTSTDPIPGGLTLTQFIQSVLVGISGIDGTLVRPKWQIDPPKQPNISVNWLAFRVIQENPDTYGYSDMDSEGNTYSQRHEDLRIQCGFYGPDAMHYAGIVRDGFQISQNLEVLRSAKMGFTSTGQPLRVPDLVNERWVERIEMEVVLRREIVRTYAILSLSSAKGTIYSDTTPEFIQDWQTPEES
jgi:hypothetical protein